MRKNLPRSEWGGAIAIMTIAFGSGQIAGPILSGYVTDMIGDLSSGLLLSSALLIMGATIGLKQKPVRTACTACLA